MHFVHGIALPSGSFAAFFRIATPVCLCCETEIYFCKSACIPLQPSHRCRVCLCVPKERGIESHPIIINIYTHVNLCASYQ